MGSPFRAGRSPLELSSLSRPGHDSRTFRPWRDGKRRRGVSFPLGYFYLTPGILPSALRASFAVRHRSCGGVDKQRRSNSGAGAGARNRFDIAGRARVKSPSPLPLSHKWERGKPRSYSRGFSRNTPPCSTKVRSIRPARRWSWVTRTKLVPTSRLSSIISS